MTQLGLYRLLQWGVKGCTTIRPFTHTHTHSIRIFLDLDTLTHATLIYSHKLMNSRTHNLNNSLIHLHTYTDLCTYAHTLSFYLQSEYITSHSSMYQCTVRTTHGTPVGQCTARLNPHSPCNARVTLVFIPILDRKLHRPASLCPTVPLIFIDRKSLDRNFVSIVS